MKIDFFGSFKTIQRTLHEDSPPQKTLSQEPAKLFSRLLDDQVRSSPPPEKPKQPEKKTDKTAPIHQVDDVLAHVSSKFLTLESKSARLVDTALTPLNPESVNKSSPALVPPQIVSIKRRDTPAAFDRLPREQRVAAVGKLINSANQTHGTDLPVPLGLAVVSAESSFKTNSISRDGHATKGLFQFLDSTGREILSRTEISSPYSPLSPEQNVSLGVKYLTYLQDIFSRPTKLSNGLETIPATTPLSNKKIAIAAFNAGEGRIASAQARALREQLNPGEYDDVKVFIPSSTRRYVESVLEREQEFQLALTR